MKQFWIVEEYKLWKGTNKLEWNTRGFISDKYEDMEETVEFLKHNDPGLILRVSKFKNENNS